MPFRGREVYEAAFAEQVDFAAILELVFIHKRANFTLAAGQLSRAGMSISTLKWPELHTIAPPSFFEMLGAITLLLPVTVMKTSPSFTASAIA